MDPPSRKDARRIPLGVRQIYERRRPYHYGLLHRRISAMKEPKIQIHYDKEGDYLEITIGDHTPAVYVNSGVDLFKRVDRKSKKVVGYAVFNALKNTDAFRDLELPVPLTTLPKRSLERD